MINLRDRWRTLAAVDSDRWACETYRVNFPSVLVIQATVAATIDDLPSADVIIGGPPCQSFSMAGTGVGEDDERNAWPEAIEAVRRVLPRMFLFENVPGMMFERHRPYADSVLYDLTGLGYRVDRQILDAVNYGVPQFRKRLWFWGIRHDVNAGHRWPKPTHQWPPRDDMFGLAPGMTVGEALGLNGEIEKVMSPERQNQRRTITTGEPSPTVAGGISGTNGALKYRNQMADAMGEALGLNGAEVGENGHGFCGDIWRDASEPIGTIRNTHVKFIRMTQHGGDRSRIAEVGGEPAITINATPQSDVGLQVHEYRWSPEMLKKHPLDVSVDGRTWESRHPIPGPTEPMPTVRPRSPRDGGRCTEQVIADGPMVRRLTPLECARLQSCPDDMVWPEGITKTAMYRIIGNGWACGMAAHLSRALAEADPESRTVIDLFCGGGLGSLGWHGRYWNYERIQN